MTAARSIAAHVLQKQVAATDPARSAFVSANAGSGKTHVLAQRVIRLLLEGCDPSCILCLTFTKAAAANMAKRVFDILAEWTTFDDAALDNAIRNIGGKPSARGRTQARRLFAQALETPGGLKVQTIHAFCTRLLHQFPFEANVAARFTVLEERAEAELIDKLRLDVLLEASAAEETSPLARALAVAVTAAADQTFAEVLRETIGERDAVVRWLEHVGGPAGAAAELARAFAIDPADTIEAVEAEFFKSPHLPMSDWPAVIDALKGGSPTDCEQAARLEIARTGVGSARVEKYIEIFCTGSFDPRKSVITKAVQDSDPRLLERMRAEQERVCALLDRRRAVAARDRTVALIAIAAEVIARYRAEKEQRGLLDYDDLIDKTLALFERGAAAWVLYKLDRGIDHILIDEAQDTSPKQWEVIRALVAEFVAGEGARSEKKRTIFAVGDEKQSIFSFQGAAPELFGEMRSRFRRAYGEDAFIEARLEHSFRSAPAILEAIDAVFRRPEAHRGLTADPVETVHQAVRERAPGVVEIWDIVKPDEKQEIEAWDVPFDTRSEASPSVKLARKIARAVGRMIGEGERVGDGSHRRPVRPGDFLILVRQRGALFEAIIRSLKDASIQVAGADRLVLAEHIAVMDLMALADALLLPADDLALATVLRSPLFGLSEEKLFELAWQRPATLRAALKAKAGTNAAFAAAAEKLDRWAKAARRDTPFNFYARVLGAEGGRARMLRRLGPEAGDALDEFLNLALDHETRETPSLHKFIVQMRTTASEVKRDMEIARDEVRVMTVHGAKGLEAPIVILADTTTPPAGPRGPRLLFLSSERAELGAPSPIVWVGAAKLDVGPLAAARMEARRAAENEHRRLLYVGMSRAADRLIVCGAEGERSRPAGCWYDLVSDALKPVASEEAERDGDKVWRLQKFTDEQAELPLGARASPDGEAIRLPPWLTRAAPKEPSDRILHPSIALNGDEPMLATVGQDGNRQQALVHGVLLHRLMQSLPDIPAAEREAAARRFLARSASEFDEANREDILAHALGILADPRFAPLAGENSRAEVPIAGRIAPSLARSSSPALFVSGQVDRLAVTETEVLIADYKTNRPAPRTLSEVPEAYVAQLALYRAVLAQTFPDRPVRALLVWTQVPDFMDIPGPALDAALSAVLSR